ncbi:hypothetical protein AB8810_12720 [Xanthomonas sp. NCPPB 3005]|uniref:hypothetical protein n=1 Tax=Xanthomonas sp. NCPPB 3005 TaxID=3240913 RepID=UPI00351206B1
MTKVEIEKRGRVAKVHPRVADMLVSRHGYLRRDMQAQAPADATPPVPPTSLQATPAPEAPVAAPASSESPKADKAGTAQAKAAKKAAQSPAKKDESE